LGSRTLESNTSRHADHLRDVKDILGILADTSLLEGTMTGRFAVPGADFPVALLEDLADEILRRFPAVEAVLYDVTSKPPATVEW
jgi:GMP synthase PP-ATPase subunit